MTTSQRPLDGPAERPSDDPTGRAADGAGDGVLQAVARRLRGPSALRRDLLRELADGLEDTVAAYRDAGLPEAEARAAAEADFGDPDVVRAACQRELTAVQARRTALTVVLALPALNQLWAWWYPAMVGRSIAEGRLLAVTHAPLSGLLLVQDVGTWLLAAAALHRFVLLGRGPGPAAAAAVAALTAAVVVLVGSTSALMMTTDGGTTLTVLTGSRQGWALAAVSAAMLSVVSALAWRTTMLTRLAVASPQRGGR